jgi:dipeptidyl aminopeptidase/acylaminoacyl peptidase
MTSERRFEQDLPKLLAQLAHEATPDYRNDIVQQTARMPQRPAWTFPERWIPMATIASRLATSPRIPWRVLVVVALLLVALVVSALLIGSSRSRLPAPFGPAANGLVAYVAKGDIYTVDPVSHVATAVVTGPEIDVAPVWSRDGTHFAFERGVGDWSQLYVAAFDGTGLILVTPDAVYQPRYAFSPDGREIAFTSGPDGSRTLGIAKADGSGARQLELKSSIQAPNYRPPNGAEIIFADEASNVDGNGIYAVAIGTGAIHQILAPTPGVGIEWVRTSPDGSRIAYETIVPNPDRNTYMVHVMAADGTGDKVLPLPPSAVFNDAPEWSNDGKRLALARGYAPYDQDMVIAIVPADGSGTGVETEHRITSCCSHAYEWAPDDSVVLMTAYGFEDQNPVRQLLIDPLTGATRPAPWETSSVPAWQRLAR